jgi:hypothetical protein
MGPEVKVWYSIHIHLVFMHHASKYKTCVGVPRPGVPMSTSECRRVPQPRWVEREAEREGGERGGRRPA